MIAKKSKKVTNVLSETEIIALDKALIEIFDLHISFRARNPIAEKIRFPPVPSILSESMVIFAARILFDLGENWNAERGGRDCDVILSDGKRRQLVEVKSTGEQGTLEIKERDVAKDWLVWVAFGTRHKLGKGKIIFYVLQNPNKYFDPRAKTNRVSKLKGFLENIGKSTDLKSYEYDSIEEFIKLAS